MSDGKDAKTQGEKRKRSKKPVKSDDDDTEMADAEKDKKSQTKKAKKPPKKKRRVVNEEDVDDSLPPKVPKLPKIYSTRFKKILELRNIAVIASDRRYMVPVQRMIEEVILDSTQETNNNQRNTLLFSLVAGYLDQFRTKLAFRSIEVEQQSTAALTTKSMKSLNIPAQSFVSPQAMAKLVIATSYSLQSQISRYIWRYYESSPVGLRNWIEKRWDLPQIQCTSFLLTVLFYMPVIVMQMTK